VPNDPRASGRTAGSPIVNSQATWDSKNVTNTTANLQGRELTRSILQIIVLAALIGGSFWVFRPYLLSTIWATMIVVATWPLMIKLQQKVRRRVVAATLMSVVMLLIFVVPLVSAIQTLAENGETVARWVRSPDALVIPQPPDWVRNVPLVGARVAEKWANLASAGREELASRLAPYATQGAQWLAKALGSAAVFTLQFLLTTVIAAIMYVGGESAGNAVLRFGRRLAGERGASAVALAGQTIRAVALGVVVTALVQTALAGLGLYVSGVPFAAFWTGVALLLCIAQIGPIIVLIPAALWLIWHDAKGWGIALFVWALVVGALDNVMRPLLIRRGAELPLLLIFAGVTGGLLAFGIIGLFVGPVVLAVTYTLLKEWVNEAEAVR